MSDPTFLSELKKYGAEDPTKEDLSAIEIELYEGPDRGMAVVLASIVEKSLEKLLRNNIRREGVEDFFKPTGILGDFGSRINVAFAFSLIGPITKRELNIIRTLRNQFAHSRKPIFFTTDVVRKCCDELKYPDMGNVFVPFHYVDKVSDARLKEASDKKHPRTRFFIACNEIAQRIYYVRSGDINDERNTLP